MVSVLLTRPRAASESLAQELERFGYRTVVEPLLTIEPFATPRPGIENIAAVMITSGHALDAAAQGIGRLFGLPCFCVGARTAEKASAAGFRFVHSAAGDGVELARLTAEVLKAPGVVLHICGQDIDSKAQDGLVRLGYRVIGWPVYKANPIERISDATADKLRQGGLDAVLVFSVRTAETLATLIDGQGLGACCDRLTAIGLSDAVAGALKPLPWRKTVAASAPTEEAVVECLKRIYPVSRTLT